VFQTASVGLVLVEEAALPLAPNVSRADVLDHILADPSQHSPESRADRLAFVIAAGGDL
jgi:hypothetical protein